MNIKFTDDQLDRFNQALDRAMDCPFIQDDDETWDDLAKLQEILNQELQTCSDDNTGIKYIVFCLFCPIIALPCQSGTH